MVQFAFFYINKYTTEVDNIGSYINRLHMSNNVNSDKVDFNKYLTDRSFTTRADILGDIIPVSLEQR